MLNTVKKALRLRVPGWTPEELKNTGIDGTGIRVNMNPMCSKTWVRFFSLARLMGVFRTDPNGAQFHAEGG